MGNRIANTRHLVDDEGEVYVAIDRRSVILDLPDDVCVASLLRARGRAVDGAAPPPMAAAPPRDEWRGEWRGERAPALAPPSLWSRLRRRVTARAAG